MYIKGEIGEEVYIKGKIVAAEIYEKGVSYKVHINSSYVAIDHVFNVNESEIMFNEKCETAEEAQPEVKRGPGRPRKATVEDLMKKSEGLREGE